MPDRAERAAHLIERIGRLVVGDGHAHALKPVQWEALRYLARANRFSCTPGALTAYLGSTKGTVSQTLGALERRGLIAKRADERDRRSVRLDLTERGARLLALDPLEATRMVIADLDAATRTALERALDALLRARLRRAGGRPFGQCRTCRFFRHEGGAPYRCALLNEPLSEADSTRICVEQEPEPSAERPPDRTSPQGSNRSTRKEKNSVR